MNLLILTQKVDIDDPILGFFHKWIEEFSKKFEKVYVICLEKGKFNLPPNVLVFSLGKESGGGRIKYLFNFYKCLFSLNQKYNTVFVHMNPEYVILGGLWWQFTGKKIALWYVHRQMDFRLRIAEFFSNKIFTVSKETFRLKSRKLETVGHGIPLEIFKRPEDYQKRGDKFRIISVGRISPIKNLEILIEATNLLQKDIPNLEVVVVGGPTQKGDDIYFERLKKVVFEKKLETVVSFVGSVSNEKIREYYWQNDVSVNLAPTGGVDKAILESMASGLPVFASNQAFVGYFGPYKDRLLFRERDYQDLARKLIEFKNSVDQKKITDFLLNSVKEKASLTSLVEKITKKIQ